MRRGEVRWYRFAQPDKKRPEMNELRDALLFALGFGG